jgi:hypothetical protein
MARRRALARIKELFEQNGIGFATPTVSVAEGGGAHAAAQVALHNAAKPGEAAG